MATYRTRYGRRVQDILLYSIYRDMKLIKSLRLSYTYSELTDPKSKIYCIAVYKSI
jgi:hypothetical protein